MDTPARSRELEWAGLPATELELPGGDRVVVAHHGAQVLSWLSAGRERLYLSPASAVDGRSPIRGGVPVCFPQFNQRGPLAGLPKHGFARQLPWAPHAPRLQADQAHLVLALSDSAATRHWWDQAFEARVLVTLSPGVLEVALVVRNTDTRELHFTGALHTYLAVQDVGQARLSGLAGHAEWDAVRDQHGSAAAELRFDGEFDRVYSAPGGALRLQDGGQALAIEQDSGWAQTVVWNPGADKGAALTDMPAQGWRQMLCVEAAQVYTPIRIAAGDFWQGAQRLRVL